MLTIFTFLFLLTSYKLPRTHSLPYTVQQDLLLSTTTSSTPNNSSSYLGEWMARNKESLKERRLSELVIPGTHFSGAYKTSFNIQTDQSPHSGELKQNTKLDNQLANDNAGFNDNILFSLRRDLGLDLDLVVRLALTLGLNGLVDAWGIRHDGQLEDQLRAGYRYLDLHVVWVPDTFKAKWNRDQEEHREEVDGKGKRSFGEYHWWDGVLPKASIISDLSKITTFARHNPLEIILLGLTCHLMGRTRPNYSLVDLMHRELGDVLVPREVGRNPKVREILATGRNVIALVYSPDCLPHGHYGNVYRRDKDSDLANQNYYMYFWDDYENNLVVKSPPYRGESDPAAEFRYWSDSLRERGRAGRLTLGLVHVGLDSRKAAMTAILLDTPVVLWTVWACTYVLGYCLAKHAFSRRARERPLMCCVTRLSAIRERKPVLVATLFTAVVICVFHVGGRARLEYGKHEGSLDLAVSSNTGHTPQCNSSDMYCRGYNHMIRYWLARPRLYAPNILLVDGYRSSRLVEAAVEANIGRVRRETSFTHLGSPIAGAPGLKGLFTCPGIILAYVVVSRDEARVVSWNRIPVGHSVIFQEGQFPMDSTIVVCVGTAWGVWLQLYSGNIQRFIEEGRDFYIRGSESRSGKGWAYISHQDDVIGRSCKEGTALGGGTPGGVLNVTRWSEQTHGRKKYPPPHYLRPTPEI